MDLLLILYLLSQGNFAQSHDFNFHLDYINIYVKISILSIRPNFWLLTKDANWYVPQLLKF